MLASPALADTDFTALTPSERAVFHSEIRAVLLDSPELLRQKPIVPGYQEDIASDLDLIAALASRLFDPTLPGFGPVDADQRIALFVAPDCPDCDRAKADLQKMAQSHELRVTLFDVIGDPELERRLGIDTLPFYIFPKMMLRGQIPEIVLERYLSNRTGQ